MRTRIADTAARLFAEKGYDAVTVLDVARAADVAEKTVYNYFPTKEHLVLDQDEEEITRIVAALRQRPAGTSPAEVIRRDVLGVVAGLGRIPPDQIRGIVGYLATVNPGVRRSCLAMIDRHADQIHRALLDEYPRTVGEAFRIRLRAYSVRLAWVYLAVIDESGRRFARGDSPRAVVTRLRPIVTALIDDIEATPPPSP
ncbi:TetR/AcrR family transcriptional regulator [Mycolicibacterium sp.]|uniref:TetR/AcrR family transcriptional regulator n=1 Tax=Mycolicibacterium sp. TaxID=2320850 RepID=UPI003D0E5DC2